MIRKKPKRGKAPNSLSKSTKHFSLSSSIKVRIVNLLQAYTDHHHHQSTISSNGLGNRRGLTRHLTTFYVTSRGIFVTENCADIAIHPKRTARQNELPFHRATLQYFTSIGETFKLFFFTSSKVAWSQGSQPVDSESVL